MAINEEMPEDVLNLILCRLPVKSLLRFKSVSKHWFSLIQNPSFISLHHKYCSQTNNSLLVKRFLTPDAQCAFSLVPANDNPILNLDVSFACPHVGNINLLGSSNGIVCLSSEFELIIILCNPATREFRVLPQPPYHTSRTSYLGFAFDPKNSDYKVVRVATHYEYDNMTNKHVDERVQLQIYYMSTDSWREIDAMVPKNNLYCDNAYRYRVSCSLNGVFYSLDCNAYGGRTVIAFHMFDELFEQEFLPYDIDVNHYSSLSVLRDSLALITPQIYWSGTWLGIWLKDGKGVEDSWSKKYSVGPISGCFYGSALGFLQNEVLLLLKDGHMVSYNPAAHTIKDYHQLYDHPILFDWFQVLSYTENLVSVKRRVY